MQSAARPAPKAKPAARPKPTATTRKKKPVARTVPPAGEVAGAAAPLPQVSSTVPSDLVVGAIGSPPTADKPGSTSVLMTSLIAFALALAALASIPTRQLAVLPATRWIVKRRFDLVIAGMGALAALLCVLLISAVFGP